MVLPFFVQSQICKAESICDQIGGTLRNDILTINSTRKCVTWYANAGTRVVRLFSFPSTPLLAVFCQFKPSSVDGSCVRSAVAIMTADTDLQVCLFSGEIFSIKLPCSMKSMISVPFGLLFQRKPAAQSYSLENLILSLGTNPAFGDVDSLATDDYFGLTDPLSALVAITPVSR